MPKFRLGVSSCLLGQRVRYDGEHKRCEPMLELFADVVEWIAVCPEREAGFGVPRPPMQLREHDGAHRLVVIADGRDVTDVMNRVVDDRVQELFTLELDGYIFKSKSPSCAVGTATTTGGQQRAGLFAESVVGWFGESLPVAEETAMHDPDQRIVFVDAVYRSRCLRAVEHERAPLKAIHEQLRQRCELLLAGGSF